MIKIKYIKQSVVAVLALVLSSCGGSDNGSGDTPNPQNPVAAKLVFPLKDSECNEGNIISNTESKVTFEWNESANADKYTLVLKNLSENSTRNIDVISVTKEVTLLRGVPYSWSIISKSNETTNTATSETWKFYNAGLAVENYAPFPAEVDTPKMGGLASVNTILKWIGSDVDDDIKEYDVYLGTASPPTMLLETTTSTSVDANGLTVDTVYYWKVVTKDNHNNATESPVFEFRTQ